MDLEKYLTPKRNKNVLHGTQCFVAFVPEWLWTFENPITDTVDYSIGTLFSGIHG